MAVLRGYLSGGAGGTLDVLLHAMIPEFVGWYEGLPADIGFTTRAALGRLAAGSHWRESGDPHPDSQANGSLMRRVVTGLVRPDPDQRRAEAAAVSALTHASAVCTDACVAYCDVVDALVAGATPTEALAAPEGRAGSTAPVDGILGWARDDAASAQLPFDHGGWVLTSLRIATWALLQPRSAEDLLVDIINLGGDSDTNGAIAGGLLGARDGATALPARWVDRLHVRDEVLHAFGALWRLRGGS